MENSALHRAVKIAGSQAELARQTGYRQQNIWYWLKRGFPPAEAVLRIERAVNGQVTRNDLRPDIFAE